MRTHNIIAGVVLCFLAIALPLVIYQHEIAVALATPLKDVSLGWFMGVLYFVLLAVGMVTRH